MSVQVLLQNISEKLKVCRLAEQRFAHKLAPRFSLFHYLRDDELGLSKCLADLLDPGGTHGQGALFLEGFLELLPEADDLDPKMDVIVELERRTLDGRRIDILVRFKNGAIGIENKPWATDQPQQLQDYGRFLSKISPNAQNWKLVFLSDRDPSSDSISTNELKELNESNQFIHLEFKRIENWLRASLYKTQAPQVRMFVEELADYIREQVIGELDMTEEREVISTIKATDENLAAAVDIVKSWHGVRDELIKDFEYRLKETIGDHDHLEYVAVEDKPLSSGKAYCRVDICHKREDMKEIIFSFSFDRKRFGQFFFGVWPASGCHPKDFQRSEDIYNRLSSEFGEANFTRNWIWYAYGDCQGAELGEGFRNWDTSAQPWVAIRNGELIEKIVRIADRAYDAIGRKG